MRVVLFTESAMRRRSDGSVVPVRDLYPRFIRPLGSRVGHLTLAARCTDSDDTRSTAAPLIENDDFSFHGMPYYSDTEEFYRRILGLLPSSLWSVFRMVRRHDVTMLRIHHCLALWVALAARVFGRPLAVYWAGPAVTEAARRNYPDSSIRHRVARFVAGLELRMNRVVARMASVNFFIDQQQYELMGSPEKTRWVVPTLVSEEDVTGEVAPRRFDEPLRIVFAGRLMQHKGVFDLVEAVGQVGQHHRVRLDFAGRGEEASALANRVSELDLESAVRFHGQLDWEALQELLRESHVFALPSHAEGLPKVMWEAWAAGLALVISPVGSISRYVTDGENGVLVSPGSPEELAKALERLAADDPLRQKLARRGMEAVRRHTWSAEVDRIGETLQQLVRPDDSGGGAGDFERYVAGDGTSGKGMGES